MLRFIKHPKFTEVILESSGEFWIGWIQYVDGFRRLCRFNFQGFYQVELDQQTLTM